MSSSQPQGIGDASFDLGLLGVAGLIFNGFVSVSIYYGNQPAASPPTR
jgi:hypothetical protein